MERCTASPGSASTAASTASGQGCAAVVTSTSASDASVLSASVSPATTERLFQFA